MAGGLGDDTYVVENAGDVVTEAASAGTDTIQSSLSWTLAGSEVENLTLTGTALTATGNAYANVLTGNAQANVLDGAAGADTLAGAAGDDTYYVDNSADAIVEASGEGRDAVIATASYHLSGNVEDLTLAGTADINAKGNALNNVLTGNSGANVLDGGFGDDQMAGGLGDDTYWVDTVGDTVTEAANAGHDTVRSAISMTLGANLEDLMLLGSSDLTATGNALDNRIYGNAGSNLINGGLGADYMKGGLGNDTYMVDNSGDHIVEASSQGHDVVFSSVDYALSNHIEDLTLTSTRNGSATGNGLDNVLTGNTGDDQLNGLGGADQLIGGLGNDTYYVDNAGDQVVENAGAGLDTIKSMVSYTLSSGVENGVITGNRAVNMTGNELANKITGNANANVIDGGDGRDLLFGGAGTDTLTGGSGDDVIFGGSYKDVFTGGTGADRFVFETGDFGGKTALTADIVTDFSHAQRDRIELGRLDANTGVDGQQDFTFIGEAGFTAAGQVRIEHSGNDLLVWGNTGGSLAADFCIKLENVQTLVAADFMF